jgi:hypothetical protein
MGVLANEFPHLRQAVLFGGERFDTMIAQKLADIEAGFETKEKKAYSLERLVLRHLGQDIHESKADPAGWRLRFAELDSTPLARWPQSALQYALGDVYYTGMVERKEREGFSPYVLENVPRLTRAAIALQLSTIRGIGVDTVLLQRIDDAARAELESAEHMVTLAGLTHRTPKDGKLHIHTSEIRKLVQRAYALRGEVAPSSPPSETYKNGQTKTDADTLVASGHPVLEAWGLAQCARKVVSGFTEKWLASKAQRVCPEYFIPMATCRVSCGNPNITQIPRPSKFNVNHGALLRQCFIPPSGYTFVWGDYAQIELCAIAQLCLWRGYGNTLANEIDNGADIHANTAARVLGCAYDPENPLHKETRQYSKGVVYGRGGGLGAGGLQKLLAGSGLKASIDYCKTLIAAHSAYLPDADLYVRESIRQWKYVSPFAVIHNPHTKPVLRLCAKPTQACNTPFQGIVAGGALDAYVELTRLSGEGIEWWPAFFVHDEIVCFVRNDLVSSVKNMMQRVMVDCMRQWIPDVAVRVDMKHGERWTKC